MKSKTKFLRQERKASDAKRDARVGKSRALVCHGRNSAHLVPDANQVTRF